MDIDYNIKLDKTSDVPLYQQLADKLSTFIEEGIIGPNCRLPAIRGFAQSLNVNNVTVVSAYKYLENKKIVYSHVGSGTYVSEIKLSEFPDPVIKNKFSSTQAVEPFDIKNAVNFAKSATGADLFPVDTFRKAFNEVFDKDGGNAFSYQESQGNMPLRTAVCYYLANFNINLTPERIQIISGAQQGIDIIAKALLSIGDVVFVEKPTYYGATGSFLSRGAQVIEIDMEYDGMDLDRLEALMKVMRPKFIYMTSYFQTPTCVSYSNDKKQRLLNLALKYDTFILEEDNQSEFVYNDEKVVPIKSLDYKNRVMYVKSFSKSIMPGLRIGFMALPKKIMNKVISAKYTTDIATSGFIQRAFELFLSSGDYDRHINDMRTVFKLRFNKACADINKYLLEYVDYNMPIGGVNIWLKLKNKQISSEGLSNLLVKDNVIITPGALFSSSGEDIPYFRLSVSSVGVENITGGIKKIGKCLKEMS